jgi:hypothetical protein
MIKATPCLTTDELKKKAAAKGTSPTYVQEKQAQRRRLSRQRREREALKSAKLERSPWSGLLLNRDHPGRSGSEPESIEGAREEFRSQWGGFFRKWYNSQVLNLAGPLGEDRD